MLDSPETIRYNQDPADQINADTYVFGSSRPGSVITCTDPDPYLDQDPSINKQKKIRKT
jgi:hypothetical protein